MRRKKGGKKVLPHLHLRKHSNDILMRSDHIQSISAYSCGSSRYILHQILAFWEVLAEVAQALELEVEIPDSVLGPERDRSHEMDRLQGTVFGKLGPMG